MVTTVGHHGGRRRCRSPPLRRLLGFTPLPPLYWPLLALTLLCYVVLTQGVKTWLLRRHWNLDGHPGPDRYQP